MREMNAKFNGTCKGCGRQITAGERILWSKEIGALHTTGCIDAYWGNEFGRHEAAQERAAYEAEMRHGQAEIARGAAAVREIQAISAPGSEFREQLYAEMEQRDYDLYG